MRAEHRDVELKGEDPLTNPEKQQEQELMGKLASKGKLPAKPATSFLQKKLQQRKFFDSGDYAMDKSKSGAGVGPRPHPLAGNNQQHQHQNPVITPVAAAQHSQNSPSRPNGESQGVADDSNLVIPRPDTVPQRKASIINPSVHCKLSPAPHVHHHDGAVNQQSTAE